MLRTFLTPLRARFDVSPRLPPQNVPESEEDGQTPEDFARDVLIELMRNSVEELKQTSDVEGRIKIMEEIHKIMNQSSFTKDVFREMDGFICVYNVLSTVRTGDILDEGNAKDKSLEVVRLVLEILSDATFEHNGNARFYKRTVGYEPLGLALEGLPSDVETTITTLGLLMSFMIHDFTLDLARILYEAPIDDIDNVLAEYDSQLQHIHHPSVLPLLWTLYQRVWTRPSVRYGFSRFLWRLASTNHRNLVEMSDAGLVTPILNHFLSSKGEDNVREKERHAWQKLLRRLLELGADPSHARAILRETVHAGDKLDPEMLDLIRYGMKSRWVDHFSMESFSTIVISDTESKGLSASGITFMAWVFLAQMPPKGLLTLFRASTDTKDLLTLCVRHDGRFELLTALNRDFVVLSKANVREARWTHVALVHYPSRSSNPSIRLFLDGVIQDGLNWAYPKADYKGQAIKYVIGGRAEELPSWCLSSAYLFATPIPDDLIRFIHHLGPRYVGTFQDSSINKFLTYEASTSLNMFLASLGAKKSSLVDDSPILKAIRHGMGFNKSQLIFAIGATSISTAGIVEELPIDGIVANAVTEGNIYVTKAACFDSALWTIGGASVSLRLVQLAQSPHEISRTLCILVDSLRNSWQNSEDMERLRGYEILADMLRRKSQHINLTSYEILFEFLGINPRNPEQSTIVNLTAYRALALDFELWSRTPQEIQNVYFEHFTTLLETSRYKSFNITQKLSKLNLVRKLLFVLQTDWFSAEMTDKLIETLGVICRADFTRDGVIKPLVSYLAANLHGELVPTSSPGSTFSHIDSSTSRGKSERILQLLINLLSSKQFYVKFAAALPTTRICLLLVGNHPSPLVATEMLKMLEICIGYSASFIRKFELVNGWNVLKTVLPYSWSMEVSDTAFGLLVGKTDNPEQPKDAPTFQCPQILPAILAALQSGLDAVASTAPVPEDSDAQSIQLTIRSAASEPGLGAAAVSPNQTAVIEALTERLLHLHSTTAQFRSIFQSQATAQLFVDGYKNYVKRLSTLTEISASALRILEKLTHFGLALALDNSVAGSQKREILDMIPTAEGILNPNAERTAIDPSLVADTRTVRQRIVSATFSLQVGERTIMRIIARIGEWRKTIQTSERKRLRKSILDLREHRRQVSQLQEWSQPLTSERGLWPVGEAQQWRLDETEGPNRIRIKLEAETKKTASSRADIGGAATRDVQAPEIAANQNVNEVPPWAESYELTSTGVDEPVLSEDVVDDKLRRIRHELEPGDVIDAVATVARIAGVDSSPGLLIIGKMHLYMLDGVVENDDGEIIDAHDAPKRLLFVPGSIVELNGPQKAQRWAHNQVTAYSEKSFLLRDVALEVYFKDSRSLLIVFLERRRRAEINHRLNNIIGRNAIQHPSTPGFLRTPGPFSGRLPASQQSRSLLGLKPDDLSTATRKWQAREISNFTYLSILNQISGRTPNDATQYPVFPWVLQDYTSEFLDLTSSSSYRDLTKPMGALTPARQEAANMRYENLESVGEKPFHFGTHFSSSMIVCHFLIRLAPFTNMFKTLQGGDWDLPDRLFSDLGRAYESAAHDIRGDVRELIPEFFTCPEFLENAAKHDFGVQQSTGERIHDVKLPPWAKGDPLLFITLHRQALESDHVSENLPAWIDLIWGCKQKDPTSLNVFHPLSYEGAINLDEINDELEKEATVGIIHNFGQTPRRLFTTPHPPRYNHGLSTLPLGTLHGIEEDSHLLTQGARCFRDLGATTPVKELLLDPVNDKVIPCPEGILTVPMYPHEQVEWSRENREIRLLVDHKVVQVTENVCCTCATLVDSDCLVTGLSDFTVRQWRLQRNTTSPSSPIAGRFSMYLSHIMRIHTDEVACITASRTWSIVVSGSRDGSAAIWDLNRGSYVRSIWHPRQDDGPTTISLVAISESTGYIASCSNLTLCLHTINGRPIATLDLVGLPSYYSPHVPSVTSLAFHEREYSKMGILGMGAPDGTITLWTWKHRDIEGGGDLAKDASELERQRWAFAEVRRLKARNLSNGRPPCITAIRFSGNKNVTDSIIPGLRIHLANSRYDWNYTTIPQTGLNDRSLPLQRGYILGGSSSVNGMVYTRGSSSDYDRFAAITGDEGWSWDNIQKYLQKHEKFQEPVDNHNITGQYDAAVHSTQGRVPVTLPGFLHPAVDNVTIQASLELGGDFQYNVDMNSGTPLGLDQVLRSSVNVVCLDGMVYTRGSSSDYDRFAAITGDEGWSGDNIQKYLQKHEKFQEPVDNHNITGQYDPAVHSTQGRDLVTPPGFLHPAVDNVTIQASLELGGDFQYNVDMNSGTPLGLGWLQSTIGHDGTRSSAATTYLDDDTRARKNLHIVTDTCVTRILKTRGTEGLDFRTVEIRNSETAEPVHLIASKEVILSGGSIGSPLILMHSGIANADMLIEFSIMPILNNTSVGKNLTDHPTFSVTFELAPASIDLSPWANLSADTDLQAKALELWDTNKSGSYVQLAAVDHLAWTRLPSNITDTFGDPSSGSNSAHIEFILGVTDPDVWLMLAVLVSPASCKGLVSISSNKPFDQPMIDLVFYTDGFDLIAAREAFKSAITWSNAPVFKDIITGLTGPLANASTEAEINNFIRNPFIPCAHTQAATYVVAERGADLIRNAWE
ncbi:hypothetical protein AN958_01769 [Leucoagaricus sp. SymC.cos]|nr:hypothetical protein AN958_01769 [Leucoagaricus sp. SymC.cos]